MKSNPDVMPLIRKLQIYRLLWQYFLTSIRYRNVSTYNLEFGTIEPNYSRTSQQNSKRYSGRIFWHIQHYVVSLPARRAFYGSVFHVIECNRNLVLRRLRSSEQPSTRQSSLDHEDKPSNQQHYGYKYPPKVLIARHGSSLTSSESQHSKRVARWGTSSPGERHNRPLDLLGAT